MAKSVRYKKAFAKQAMRFCKNGATQKDLADFFKVNITTIKKWKKAHKEFAEAIDCDVIPPQGQPPKYETPAQLQEAIDNYFNNPDTKKIIIGDELVDVEVLTVTGLALSLGFESRQSLYDYAKKAEYSYIIKKAKLRIENDYEIDLRTKDKTTGTIFGLKQMGWHDTQQIKVGEINESEMTDAELESVISQG